MVKKFVRKPELVSAIQYTGENKKECVEFTEKKAYAVSEIVEDGQAWVLFIKEGDNVQKGETGCYIIKDSAGNYSFCSKDVFEAQFMEDKSGNIYEVYIKVEKSEDEEAPKDEFIGENVLVGIDKSKNDDDTIELEEDFNSDIAEEDKDVEIEDGVRVEEKELEETVA